MTAEAIHPVQFLVDAKGERTAVVLDVRAWELLSEWIETVTDRKIALDSMSELEAAGGRPERAGWLSWDEVRDFWDEEDS